MKTEALMLIETEWSQCQRCRLAKTRDRVVFWRGSVDARIALVGEGPGADENRTGIPFVGRAGKRLDKLVARAGLDPLKDIFVLNLVACRPPSNRDPLPDEVASCSSRFARMLSVVHPKVIVTLGAVPAGFLVGMVGPISRWRGNPTHSTLEVGTDKFMVTFVPTFHPSYALRAGLKVERDIVSDLRLAKRMV